MEIKYDKKNRIIEESVFNENHEAVVANDKGLEHQVVFSYSKDGDFLQKRTVFTSKQNILFHLIIMMN